MLQYTAPQVQPTPLPYEVAASTIRYSKDPVKPHPSASLLHSATTEHAMLMQAGLDTEPESPVYASTDQEFPVYVNTEPEDGDHTYYSRPKFFKQERGFSTSTHIYGECGSSQSTSLPMYISPNQLEPFFSKDGNQISDRELMLEESTGYTSSDYLPSDAENDPSMQASQTLTERSLNEPSSWLEKSPATGQIDNTKEHSYVNARHIPRAEGNEANESVYYVNTTPVGSVLTPHSGSAEINQMSIKSTPKPKPRKKKKLRRNHSTPAQGQRGPNDTYTSLMHETSNYTSVYASTLRPEGSQQQY